MTPCQKLKKSVFNSISCSLQILYREDCIHSWIWMNAGGSDCVLSEIQLRFLVPDDIDDVKALCSDWFPIEYVHLIQNCIKLFCESSPFSNHFTDICTSLVGFYIVPTVLMFRVWNLHSLRFFHHNYNVL